MPQRVVAGSSGFCFPGCSFSDFFPLPEYWNSLGFWLSEAQYPPPFWALRPSPSSSGGYYWWQPGRPLSTLPACSILVHPSLQRTWAACPSVGEGGFMSSFLPGLQALCRGDHLLPIRRPWGLRRTTQEMLVGLNPPLFLPGHKPLSLIGEKYHLGTPQANQFPFLVFRAGGASCQDLHYFHPRLLSQ